MRDEKLEADFAITLQPKEARDLEYLETSCYLWSGWKRHHWPANIIRHGVRLYGFDKRTRRLCVLLEITRGGSFSYRTLREFRTKVTALTGWQPAKDDPHWNGLPIADSNKYCTGVALRWRVIKPVSIKWETRFPQLGWQKLRAASLLHDIESLVTFAEGDKRLRTHLAR